MLPPAEYAEVHLRGAINIPVPSDTPVDHCMERGPSTVRPDIPALELAQRLLDSDLRTAIVTTPEGRLLGIALRPDLEERSGVSAA